MEYASALPREVLVKIFSSLTPNPESTRDLYAAASVCPSWRDAANEPCLWRKLWVSKAPLNARLSGPHLQNLVARSHNTLTRLRLVGCLLVTDVMLALSLQQQPCLVFVAVSGCALVTRPSLAYALCYREDFQGVVVQLNDPRQSAADAQRCCVALQTLLCEEDKEASRRGTNGWYSGGYAALCCATRGTRGSAGCMLLGAVAGTPGVPALLDAIPPVLAALRAFPTDLDVQEYGCKSLAKMCGMDASVAEAAAASGAMGLFLKAMRLDITAECTPVAAVDAIEAIALSKAALPQASAGIDAVVRALRRHEKNSEFAVAACKTLGIYLRCPATRERALGGCADFAITAAAAAHRKDTKVKKAAKDALQDPQAAYQAYLQLPNKDYASTLPREVLVRIFSGLTVPRTRPNPGSVRDLCASASVCPSWREAAKEPCLWRELYVREAPLNERLTGPRLRNLVARSRNTLTEFSLTDCPLVTDAALALSLQQQPRLVYVRVTGCALVTRPGLALALCDAENFQGVVVQLNDPRQSAADAQRCCVALHMLDATEDEVTLEEAQTAGALDALLRCAALHAAHAGVQAACCWALSEYISVFYWRAEVASFPPVFQAAVAALKAHPLDVDVQRAALNALHNVCNSGLVGTPGVPALLDAIPLVLAAMRAFPTDLGVQYASCESLERMCGMNASVAEAVAAAGAMGHFIKVLHLDLTKDSSLILAVNAIEAIALAPAALPQASSGIDAVVHALRHLKKNSEFAEAACKTLGAYLRCAATRERALRAGADFAITATAAAHRKDAKVKKAAKDALKVP